MVTVPLVVGPIRIILRLALVLGLVVTPLFAAAHAAEHVDAAGPDHACVLCQAGDRDDDAAVPELASLALFSPAPENALPAPQAGLTTFLLTARNRGPPLSLLA